MHIAANAVATAVDGGSTERLRRQLRRFVAVIAEQQQLFATVVFVRQPRRLSAGRHGCSGHLYYPTPDVTQLLSSFKPLIAIAGDVRG